MNRIDGEKQHEARMSMGFEKGRVDFDILYNPQRDANIGLAAHLLNGQKFFNRRQEVDFVKRTYPFSNTDETISIAHELKRLLQDEWDKANISYAHELLVDAERDLCASRSAEARRKREEYENRTSDTDHFKKLKQAIYALGKRIYAKLPTRIEINVIHENRAHEDKAGE